MPEDGAGVPCDEPRCIGCDYVLRGLASQRCPECGRHFDLGVLGTVNCTGRPLGRLRRASLDGSSKWLTVSAAAAFCHSVWYSRAPGLDLRSLLVSIALWSAVIVAWCVVIAIGWLTRVRLHQDYAFLRTARSHLIVPLLTACMLILNWFDAPLRIGFLLSQRQLMGALQEMENDGREHLSESRWVGVYKISAIDRRGYSARFTIAGRSLKGMRYGFAHDPSTPPSFNARGYRKVARHWYVWWGIANERLPGTESDPELLPKAQNR
jgi:hypothetical protein